MLDGLPYLMFLSLTTEQGLVSCDKDGYNGLNEPNALPAQSETTSLFLLRGFGE